MTPVEVGDLPAALARLAAAASALGWSVTATAAVGPPSSIALRFAADHDGVAYRAWALWRTDDRVSFHLAGCRHVPPGRLGTLRAVKSYLGIA